MSIKALGADLAHEIGHAFSLLDRGKGEIAGPNGEINLMCSGVANACA